MTDTAQAREGISGRGIIHGASSSYDDTLRRMETFFCKGMLLGYPTGPNETIGPHRNILGWKEYNYARTPFLLTDEWSAETGRTWIVVLEGTLSVGCPVWVMHYEGWCREGGASLLKLALAAQYQKRFHGGRGPAEFSDAGHPDLLYSNDTEGTFRRFSGREEILNVRTETLLCQHHYWGGMLI